MINQSMYEFLITDNSVKDFTTLQNRRDLAYACQTETQEQVLRLIRRAVEMSGKKRVVISGGYGLNCVANYFYLKELKDEGIEIYVEPISNDGGTAIGAALLYYHQLTASMEKQESTIYLGPEYSYENEYINDLAAAYSAEVSETTKEDIVKLLREKNIVTMFQGRSENGPRALGNRSVLFDPTFTDGKDFVNGVKRREYFRPFAGTVLKDRVHEWFDLRGMEESPHMMYAVNCQPGIAEKIPSIIHVDGTCRIQTVTLEQNKHFYELIEAFEKESKVPVLFNTSFNLGGDPLVETLEDAMDTLSKSRIEYLYLPEYNKLIYIKNT
jgi:carbamoyltransferase